MLRHFFYFRSGIRMTMKGLAERAAPEMTSGTRLSSSSGIFIKKYIQGGQMKISENRVGRLFKFSIATKQL